jgi:hypothetical protein
MHGSLDGTLRSHERAHVRRARYRVAHAGWMLIFVCGRKFRVGTFTKWEIFIGMFTCFFCAWSEFLYGTLKTGAGTSNLS